MARRLRKGNIAGVCGKRSRSSTISMAGQRSIKRPKKFLDCELASMLLKEPKWKLRRQKADDACAQHTLSGNKSGHPAAPGVALEELIRKIRDKSTLDLGPLYGRLCWAKVSGFCHWPCVAWPLSAVCSADLANVLEHFQPGRWLVRYYGKFDYSFVLPSRLSKLEPGTPATERRLLKIPTLDNREVLGATALQQLQARCHDDEAEIDRIAKLARDETRSSLHGLRVPCAHCLHSGATLRCQQCGHCWHCWCISPATLSYEMLLSVTSEWCCKHCQHKNEIPRESSQLGAAAGVDRYGLTPDWIIIAAAFRVFQLEPPSEEMPYIKGLMDPCTNSKMLPNIPAEVLYDVADDGLSRAFEGHYVLLNPPFDSKEQWRWINHAIDEVESGRSPAVVLVCRNSTDAEFFQRLRPYPKVFLLASNSVFRDYDTTPRNFGVACVCIALRSQIDLHERFLVTFGPFGEACMAIDHSLPKKCLQQLLQRAEKHAIEHYRDHWLQCSLCNTWRKVSHAASLAAIAQAKLWRCEDRACTTCDTPCSRAEGLLSRTHAESKAERDECCSLGIMDAAGAGEQPGVELLAPGPEDDPPGRDDSDSLLVPHLTTAISSLGRRNIPSTAVLCRHAYKDISGGFDGDALAMLELGRALRFRML